jgi:hypothetical protein
MECVGTLLLSEIMPPILVDWKRNVLLMSFTRVSRMYWANVVTEFVVMRLFGEHTFAECMIHV